MKSSEKNSRLAAGDLVQVRAPQEIFKTLDANGTLDGLPFMPEMAHYCGQRFRVMNRVVQTTIDGAFLPARPESFIFEFRNDDVVTLANLRCSGAPYDHCQRGCSIFWKEAWLEKVGSATRSAPLADCAAAARQLVPLLKTRSLEGKYFCQSSEFLKATAPLSATRRLKKCYSAVAARNTSAFSMAKRIGIWLWWRVYAKFFGNHARGALEKTPTEALGLQPGELVEVKSLAEIVATLDREGHNRGLHFSADQRPFCGKRFRVRSRADNFIAESTGEMKHFKNTVILEDVLCDSATFAFGGCYRADLLYWREIWLRRVEAAPVPEGAEGSCSEEPDCTAVLQGN